MLKASVTGHSLIFFHRQQNSIWKLGKELQCLHKLVYYLWAVWAQQWWSNALKGAGWQDGDTPVKAQNNSVLQKLKPIKHCKTSWTWPLKHRVMRESAHRGTILQKSLCVWMHIHAALCSFFLLPSRVACLCSVCMCSLITMTTTHKEAWCHLNTITPTKGVYRLTCGPHWFPVIRPMCSSNQKEIWQWVVFC